MMIRVLYSDGRFDMVKPDMLDTLLNRQIVSNYRGRERRLP
jgi:hypothetical protein